MNRLIREGIKYSKKKHRAKTGAKIKLKNTQRMVKSKFNKIPDPIKKKVGRPPDSEAMAEAKRQFKEVYDNLKARMNRLNNRYLKKIGNDEYAVESPAYKEYRKRGMDKYTTKGKSLEQIYQMTQEAKYIDSLKTSRYEGYINYVEHIEPLFDLYDSDKDTFNKIMFLYNRLVEENGILERFKYEVLDMVADLTMSNYTTKDIAEIIRDWYKQIYENEKAGVEHNYVYEYGGKVRTVK